MAEPWTIKRVLEWTRGYLERKGDEHPRRSAEWLLSSVTGKTRVELYLAYDQPLEKPELDAMHAAIERRAAGEPLQYVTGEMPFRHLVLRCERGVLIPRPETEVLVDEVLAYLDGLPPRSPQEPLAGDAVAPDSSERPEVEVSGAGPGSQGGTFLSPAEKGDAPDAKAVEKDGASDARAVEKPDASSDVVAGAPVAELVYERVPEEQPPAPEPGLAESLRCVREDVADNGLRVLDVGTGSGCIALSVASERPGTRVWAVDLSPEAVALALRNRDSQGLQESVEVLEGDLTAPVPAELLGTFDVLVSNPPYVPSAVMATLPLEVAGFEPELALCGGEDGLDVFRRLLEAAPRVLRPGGLLACELFEGHLDQAADLVRAEPGWASVEVKQDLTGRPRVLLAVREEGANL